MSVTGCSTYDEHKKEGNLFFLLYLESALGRTISNNKNIQISPLKRFPQLEGKFNFFKIFYRITLVKF